MMGAATTPARAGRVAAHAARPPHRPARCPRRPQPPPRRNRSAQPRCQDKMLRPGEPARCGAPLHVVLWERREQWSHDEPDHARQIGPQRRHLALDIGRASRPGRLEPHLFSLVKLPPASGDLLCEQPRLISGGAMPQEVHYCGNRFRLRRKHRRVKGPCELRRRTREYRVEKFRDAAPRSPVTGDR